MAHNTKRLVLTLIALAFTTSAASAAPAGATLSGYVKASNGQPQMGAVIEVFTTAAAPAVKAFTDAKGYYFVQGLAPGNYFVKATATQFLPSLRENVSVAAGSSVIVNLTLNTLMEAFQLIPPRRVNNSNDDDWRWTLRSAANRPILRVLDDDGPLVVVSRAEDNSDRTLKARVAFIAGSDGQSFSPSDMKTAFSVEQSIFGTGTMQFGGNLGYDQGFTNGVVRAAYKQQLANGAAPEIAITALRFATPDTALHHAALNALAVTMSNNFSLADFIELNLGSELQTVQFRGRATAFRPFGTVTAHLGKNTLLEYSYATSQPTTRMAKGFDSAPADLTETNPRVSLRDGMARIERARHQEVALSQRVGKNNFQAAYFFDRVADPALIGVGDVNQLEGMGDDFLPDVYSSTFTYTGNSFATQGFRLVGQRKLSEDWTGTVNYSFGGALSTPQTAGAQLLGGTNFVVRNQHALTGKVSGRIPKSKTRVLASYKWASGRGALTPVDMFNASAGQSDPYLNIFLRQPIPGTSFIPGKMEALIDVRNLLSQGYIPLIGQDGRTLYLVQSARAIRGGVAFNF
jgi:hypothetical protein